MIYILKLVLSLLLFFAIYFLLKKYSKLISLLNIIDKNYSKPQSFHDSPIPRIGGIFLILNLTIFTFYHNFFLETEYLFLLFSIPFFFVGFIDDAKIIENPKIRLALLISTIIGFAIISNLKIDNTGIELLNNMSNEYFLFQLIFILFCFLTIINGSNFIDGFNGLLILHSIIIFTILTFINFENYLFIQTLTILFSFFVIIFFNFPKAKFFLGDSGAYTIGFLISYFVIRTANENNDISPIFFCILLFYLFYEVLFSFCRKKILKLNPLKPDHNHLHMIIYRIINKNIIKNRFKSNYTTSIIINLFYLFLIIPSIFIYENGFLCKIYFIFLVSIYTFFYFILKKYETN